MRIPSLKTILSTTSSIFYCIRQGIVFWRTVSNSGSSPETEEQLDSTIALSDTVLDATKDNELSASELKDIYERLAELRESFNFVPIDKEKEL